MSLFPFSVFGRQDPLLSILALIVVFGRAPVRNVTHTAIGFSWLQLAKQLSEKSRYWSLILHVPSYWANMRERERERET